MTWDKASDAVEALYCLTFGPTPEVSDGDFSAVLAAGRDILLDGGTRAKAILAMQAIKATV